MKMIIRLLLLSVVLSFSSATKGQTTQHNIIPAPQSIAFEQGAFTLNAHTSLKAKGKEAKSVADFFVQKMRRSTGLTLPVNDTKRTSNVIELSLSKISGGDEAYELQVTTDGATLKANTKRGLFFGMQTLMQLLPSDIENLAVKDNKNWSLPCVRIKDYPRFPYRGVMIDVCRHFMPIETLKKQIDVLSLYKINTLHLHLTEDQGWRVEIKKYPKLTEVGAWRTEADGTRHGGFYTQEQLKDLVRYAAEREITIVPEFEIPGHELAAISAYPWLSCREEAITPRIIWGVEDIVMCPGKPQTFRFLEDVIEELVAIFPSTYFHIGGDEAPKKEWKNCLRCQALIAQLGYKDKPHHPKEEQLQNYVVAHVEKVLNKYGKRLIGWDEILEGGNLTPTATVMSWRGESGGIAAAKAGHDVIMTPGSGGLYIDAYQGDPKVEPVAIGGYAPLSKTYAYNPTPDVLIKDGKANFVKGAQVNIWGEYVHTPEHLEYMIYPRALALAELTWTEHERKNFDDFVRRLDTDAMSRLTSHGINAHIPIPEQPGGSCDFLVLTDSTQVSLKTTRPATIVYTINGEMPTPSSTRYTQPLTFRDNATLKVATVLPSGNMSRVRTINVEKQMPSPAVTLTTDVQQGLQLTKIEGTYFKTSDIQSGQKTTHSAIKDLKELRTLTPVPDNVRNVKDYAAIAEGFIEIPTTGVYTFSSNNAEVFIDGVKVIDNNDIRVKKSLRRDAQRALSAGKHHFKVVFLGNIIDGWPSYWDDAKVWYKLDKEQKFREVTPDMLFYQNK